MKKIENKTTVLAEDHSQEIHVHRSFNLPVGLLFKAYTEPALLEQWMGTKVIHFEAKPHGGWRFETSNDRGSIVFSAHGVIHELRKDSLMVRTFQMENNSFPAQLEFLEFVKVTEHTSSLHIQMIFKSTEHRDNLLKLPFQFGLNMAHNLLEQVLQS
jgi:uncharacterized protein YndB with AHSA1/START domain